MINSYVCIDLETTGLNPREERITEIGGVKVIEGVEVGSFHTLVDPGKKLEKRITELTGLRDEDLARAPQIREVLPEFIDFAGDLPLLGHSVLFDYSFLKKAAVNSGIPFEKMGIDTLKIARKYLPLLEHRNLGYLCAYYGIAHQAHRALEDARATKELYEKLSGEFYREEDPLFQPAPLIFRVRKDVPASPAQKQRLYRLIEQHKIIFEENVEGLTRSQASRWTDRILSGYFNQDTR